MPERKSTLKRLARQPFMVLAAIGVISTFHELTNLRDWLETIILAWQSMTRPFWDWTIGWLLGLIGWSLPRFLADYLTLSAIIASISMRALRVLNDYYLASSKKPAKDPIAVPLWKHALGVVDRWIFLFLRWPFVLIIIASLAVVLHDIKSNGRFSKKAGKKMNSELLRLWNAGGAFVTVFVDWLAWVAILLLAGSSFT